MRNQRGMVLPLTLIVMVVLASLTLAMVSMAGFEPIISRNLADVTQARFAAEAGLEFGYNVVADTMDWSTLIAAADPTYGVYLGLAGGTRNPIGALTTARGAFVVTLRNDHQVSDEQMTGRVGLVPLRDPTATADANNILILTSTGFSSGRADAGSTRLRAVIKRPASLLNNLPAALAFPGNDAETVFSGNSFEIDGRGWKMNPPDPSDPDNASNLDGGCASVFGVSVSQALPAADPGGNEDVVEDSLTGQQQDNVRGKKQDSSLPANGSNTIAPNSTLSPDFIKAYIDQAKASADLVLESRQADNGLSFSNVQWGTPTEPKIVYVKGEPDPSSMFNALRISGDSQGYGILIVEDGDLRISGNFLWNGPIIVTGQWVGVGFLGGGEQMVYGAIVSNELATDAGFYEGVVTGNAKLRYSCQALMQPALIRKLTSAGNWKELAPGE